MAVDVLLKIKVSKYLIFKFNFFKIYLTYDTPFLQDFSEGSKVWVRGWQVDSSLARCFIFKKKRFQTCAGPLKKVLAQVWILADFLAKNG